MSLLAVALAALLPGVQGIAPRVTAIEPAGGQRGTEVVVRVRGERFGELAECLFEAPGIDVLAATAAAADRAELRLALRPDCPLGSHALRLRTGSGCSNVFLFSVTSLPCVAEQREGTGEQEVALGTTVEAVLRGDETDRYRLRGAAGAPFCCEVEALRLGQDAIDVELVMVHADGTERRIDDAAPGGKDPWCAGVLGPDGAAMIAVRAAVPGDGPRGAYRLHAGSFVRPVGALPCGGQPGEELEVELVGDSAGQRARVRLPDDGRQLFAWVPELEGAAPPTPIWCRVGGPPNRQFELDAQQRRWFEVPGAVHGVVADASSPPRLWFKAQKGVELEFVVHARSLRSPLDPAVVVRAADGRFLAYNDDGDGIDSVLRFSPPADGDYSVEVRDLLRTASPAHFFRLEAAPRSRVARVQLSVQRQVVPVVMVPQGGHGAAVLQLQNVEASASVRLAGVPLGVATTIGPRLPGNNLVPVLFSASADAALAGAMLRVGTVVGDGEPDWRSFRQTHALLSGRNDTPLLAVDSARLPLAVGKAVPWRAEVGTSKVPLIRGAFVELPVTIVRREGYTNRLRVRPVWAPAGLSVGQTIVDANATQGTLRLEASGDAPVGEFPCLLTTIARVDGAVCEHALPFLMVRVEEPWVRAEPGKARTNQGKNCELPLALTIAKAATAPYPAVLQGLPRGVTAGEQVVAPDATQVVFALTVAADAPVGRHRGLAVELRLPGPEGAVVLHRFAAGELRIDPPRRVIGAPAGAAGGRP
ncbi:MAG: hypothetical protein IPK26_16715 [Planctomycetes bacterium]|nr:hypothetical protein [Planctomycetota bacterium]